MDFTALRNDLVNNVEIFNLGNGNQNITLNHLDVLSITGDANTAISNPSYQKGHVLAIAGSSLRRGQPHRWLDPSHQLCGTPESVNVSRLRRSKLLCVPTRQRQHLCCDLWRHQCEHHI